MKRIYRLLVILMGCMIFIGIYVALNKQQYASFEDVRVPAESEKN